MLLRSHYIKDITSVYDIIIIHPRIEIPNSRQDFSCVSNV